MTQCIRAELASQGTHVVGVYPGPVDTDMTAGLDWEKAKPSDVADSSLRAVAEGIEDVDPDKMAVDIRNRLAEDPKGAERYLAEIALDP
jgi:NAD(P)-dependent dehydrogenase (short-subunit alcohol dehydrogenase family)